MDTPVYSKKSSTRKRMLVLAVAVVAVAAIVGLVRLSMDYYKVKDDISLLEKSVKALKENDIQGLNENDVTMHKKLDEIGKKLSSAQEPTVPSVSPEYALASITTHRQPSNPYENTGKDFLFLEVSIRNTNNQSGYIALSDMKFKDESGQTYSIHPGYPVSAYPGGLQPLNSQALAANETVKGTLVYLVPTDTKKFVLSYSTTSVEVSAQ